MDLIPEMLYMLLPEILVMHPDVQPVQHLPHVPDSWHMHS